MGRRLWTENELKLTLSLYFQLPFGRLHRNTPEVIELADLIGRTNNSVALRLVNFAACDPYILATGRHGMSGGEAVCQPMFDKYCNKREELFIEAEKIKADMLHLSIENQLGITQTDLKGETREAVVKQRINQNVFRTMILNNYESTCAISGISVPEVLVASHIIPWSADEPNRLNPENGLCLSSLYDKLFDCGLNTVSPDDLTVVISNELKQYRNEQFYEPHFGSIEHKHLILPDKMEFRPNPKFLEYHNKNIFSKHD